MCELRVLVKQWWVTGFFYLLCSLLVNSSPDHVQLRMYPPSDFVGLTDPAHDGQFWVCEHSASHNWALCLYQSQEHATTCFSKDVEFFTTDDMHLAPEFPGSPLWFSPGSLSHLTGHPFLSLSYVSNTIRSAESVSPSDRADGASSLNLLQSSSSLWALVAPHITVLPDMK